MLGTLMKSFVIPLAFACGPAFAQTLPAERQQGDVTFITGGIGKDEADAMRAVAKSYPLALEFIQHAPKHDQFQANVIVFITDAAGKTVLNATSDGPFLFARLPAGKYTVRAQTETGGVKQQAVQIAPKGHQRIVFEWMK